MDTLSGVYRRIYADRQAERAAQQRAQEISAREEAAQNVDMQREQLQAQKDKEAMDRLLVREKMGAEEKAAGRAEMADLRKTLLDTQLKSQTEAQKAKQEWGAEQKQKDRDADVARIDKTISAAAARQKEDITSREGIASRRNEIEKERWELDRIAKKAESDGDMALKIRAQTEIEAKNTELERLNIAEFGLKEQVEKRQAGTVLQKTKQEMTRRAAGMMYPKHDRNGVVGNPLTPQDPKALQSAIQTGDWDAFNAVVWVPLAPQETKPTDLGAGLEK